MQFHNLCQEQALRRSFRDQETGRSAYGTLKTERIMRKLVDGYFLLKLLGPARIKGVSEPVSVYEVTRLELSLLKTLSEQKSQQRGREARPASSLAICRAERVRATIRAARAALPVLVGVLKIVPISEGARLIANKRPPRLPGTSVHGRQVAGYVAWETLNPSMSSSPWIRGAPQRKFSRAIRLISSRTSRETLGRPPSQRSPDRYLHSPDQPLRRQRLTVSG